MGDSVEIHGFSAAGWLGGSNEVIPDRNERVNHVLLHRRTGLLSLLDYRRLLSKLRNRAPNQVDRKDKLHTVLLTWFTMHGDGCLQFEDYKFNYAVDIVVPGLSKLVF